MLNKKIRIVLLYCCGLIGWQSVAGQVKLPRLVSDGMVLQRGVPIKVWGWAAPGENITVKFDGEKVSAVTGDDREWSVLLKPRKAGGPYIMEVDGINHIRLKDILVGDVWVCSGQSNMELPMERVKEKYAEVIAHAGNPSIRQFSVATRYNFNETEKDLSSGRWESADTASILQFTAAGYFFARTLFEKYHVPIGLLKASVGGSPAEAWLSENALYAFPAYREVANRYKDNAYPDSIAKNDKAISDEWYRNIRENDKGLQGERPWYDPAYDASAWKSMALPGYWADQGLSAVNGVVWFRKEIEVPAAMTGQPAALLLGRIVDRDSVYVNGQFAGTIGYQYPPRRYTLPSGLLKPGRNIIIVRVINSAGRGGFVPGKPYQLSAAGQTIDLTGNWQYQLGVASGPLPAPTFFQYQPGGLFNGMIAPLLPYAIKGVIWYQGESNTDRAGEYRTLFPALIADWRAHWQEGNFPFLYVQLAGYMATKDQPSESNWAGLREAQRLTLSVPATAMAVTADIGEWNDIHPLDKEDVGKRLALAAEKLVFGDRWVVPSGPLYESMHVSGNEIHVRFSNIGEGLVVRGGGELRYFAIAGADKKFVWAKARISGDKVIVWNEQVQHPVAVRYGWADNPDGANLYNKSDNKVWLPASPFSGEKK
ncbi:MAG TPA: sialate O-acetylesterase [Puia sp.]|nr:sialate O-acetylesterase [Puia sp.]